MANKKSDLRNLVRYQVAQISEQDRQHKGQKIAQNLAEFLASFKWSKAELKRLVLGVYAPLKDEPNWLQFFNCPPHVELAFPRPSISDDQSMEFVPCLPSELVAQVWVGKTEILVPPSARASVVPSVIAVPGLAFGHQGERLGRGKGYYDRYLEQYQGLKIGVCFHEQLILAVPVDAHDKLMDAIVTDKQSILVKTLSKI